jgi:hypothetical protein
LGNLSASVEVKRSLHNPSHIDHDNGFKSRQGCTSKYMHLNVKALRVNDPKEKREDDIFIYGYLVCQRLVTL